MPKTKITAMYDPDDDDWHFENVPISKSTGWPCGGKTTFSNSELGFPYCKNGAGVNKVTPEMAIRAFKQWRKE